VKLVSLPMGPTVFKLLETMAKVFIGGRNVGFAVNTIVLTLLGG